MVSPFLEGYTLDEALTNKKLFICDLTMLEDVPLMGVPVEKEVSNLIRSLMYPVLVNASFSYMIVKY